MKRNLCDIDVEVPGLTEWTSDDCSQHCHCVDRQYVCTPLCESDHNKVHCGAGKVIRYYEEPVGTAGCTCDVPYCENP